MRALLVSSVAPCSVSPYTVVTAVSFTVAPLIQTRSSLLGIRAGVQLDAVDHAVLVAPLHVIEHVTVGVNDTVAGDDRRPPVLVAYTDTT